MVIEAINAATINASDTNTSVLTANIMRTVVLALGGGVLLMALLVNVIYSRLFMADRRVAKAQGRKLSWRGLLPTHVILISLSYMALIVQTTVGTVNSVDRGVPFRWQNVTTLGAYVFGFLALRAVLRYQKRVYPRRPADPENPPAIDTPPETSRGCPFHPPPD